MLTSSDDGLHPHAGAATIFDIVDFPFDAHVKSFKALGYKYQRPAEVRGHVRDTACTHLRTEVC